MSQTFAEVVRIDAVDPHPNADKLEIAIIRGTKVVIQKDSYRANDTAIYFPPDLLIPESRATHFGVANYLKHAIYPGDLVKTRCRVAACRLRGQPSYGFVMPDYILPEEQRVVGNDVSESFDAVKYEPAVRQYSEDAAPDHPSFHRYTNIENYSRYPTAIPVGTIVRITEKIHGANSRVGLIRVDGEFQFMAGSHNVNRKRPADECKPSIYWEPLTDHKILELLTTLCDERNDVIVFGEIYGPGIEDLDYGVLDRRGYRVFDISLNGQHLGWAMVESICKAFHVDTVPLLYKGPFSHDLIEQYTHGPTTVGHPSCRFKGREGVVITPISEKHSDILGGRMILKSVSADYLDRKDGEDIGE